MVEIQRIKPAIADRIVTPQCETPTTVFAPTGWSSEYLKRRAAKYAAKGYDPDKCCCPSTYVIDGRYLCTKHAGQAALKILTRLPPRAQEGQGGGAGS